MGFFSWITQDTHRSINNAHCGLQTFPVTLTNPVTGEQWTECDYDGYGEFNGKDYYELLAELNGGIDRSDGIDMYFHCESESDLIWPTLTEDPNAKVTGKPQACPEQGYFYMDGDVDPYTY
mgnify:CR=1 FL=1